MIRASACCFLGSLCALLVSCQSAAILEGEAKAPPRPGVELASIRQDSNFEVRLIDGPRGVIRAYFAAPPGATGSFIIAHGYGASSRAFMPLGRALTRSGYAVLLVDLPGQGGSYGPRGEIGDFREYGEALAAAFGEAAGLPRPWIGFGHSLGAIAVYEAMDGVGASFDGAILAMPLSRSSWWHPLRLLGFLAKPFTSTYPGAGFGRVPISWVEALAAWNRRGDKTPLAELPGLVFLGGQDKVVDRHHQRRTFRELLPLARFIVLPDAGHHELESAEPPPEVLAQILDFARNEVPR